MLYYAVYAACLACVCDTMQYYNCGFFDVAIALRACYCVHIAIAMCLFILVFVYFVRYCVHISIAMWLFIVCAVGIVL